MKTKALKAVLLILLLIGFSCDEPKTTLTDIVHPDGSVTRKIEMRNDKNMFKLSDLQVPFDSSWTIKDTIVIGNKKDTTWIKTAEKLFKSAEEINKSYSTDKGANKNFSRIAAFSKRFRWFNTVYRFSERIDKIMSHGYLLKDFLNQEELNYFYSPESVNSERQKSADSLKYKTLADTINKKTDLWLVKSLASEWIFEFSRLIEGKAGKDLTGESLKAREDELIKIINKYDSKFDSLWAAGVILKEMIGEKNAITYRSEADSSIAFINRILSNSFKDYSVRIIMPGKIIGTNGFIDKTETLLWPVKSDYFTTEQYEMWAESKVINKWAWVITGVFILFVVTGLLIRLIRRRE